MQLSHRGIQNDDHLTALTHLRIDACTPERIHSSHLTLYVFREHEVIQLSQQRSPCAIRIPDFCCPEHPSPAEVWILLQEKSIGHDGADQRGYSRGYKVFFRLYGADELKNGPNNTFGS
jgi:hypothetical protein